MAARDRTLDIAKGICIILMVVGHSGCPAYVYDFVYMFHMPCFFFISGWLLRDGYLDDLRRGLRQKARGSYLPFVKWTLLFLFLHNAFTYLHVYATYYTPAELAWRALQTFTLTGCEALLGGFWFLASLFWASVGSLLYLWLLRRTSRLRPAYIAGMCALLLLAAVLWHHIPLRLPQMFGERTLLAAAFYLSGYLCRRSGLGFRPSHALLLLVPAVAAFFIQLNMVLVEGWLVLPEFIVATAGTLGILGLSSWLAGRERLAVSLSYTGRRTLHILTFHILAFKAVSALYLYANGLPAENLVTFPVLNEDCPWLWVAYSLAGVIAPLCAKRRFLFPVFSL